MTGLALSDLHGAGAEVAAPHALAWQALPAVKTGQARLIFDIRELRKKLGRAVLPADITGQPVPESAQPAATVPLLRAKDQAGDQPAASERARQRASREPTPELLGIIEAHVEAAGRHGVTKVATRLNVPSQSIHNWRSSGRVPAAYHNAVRALGRAPAAPVAPEDAPAVGEPTPQAEEVEPLHEPEAPDEGNGDTEPATLPPADLLSGIVDVAPSSSRTGVTHGPAMVRVDAVLAALGLRPVQVYVIEDGRLVERVAAVLG